MRYTDLREWSSSSRWRHSKSSRNATAGAVANPQLVNVNKLNSMHAEYHIEMLREIMLKKAINVKSTDNACFTWSPLYIPQKKM